MRGPTTAQAPDVPRLEPRTALAGHRRVFVRTQVKAAWQQDFSLSEIAAALGRSQALVQRLLQEADVEVSKQPLPASVPELPLLPCPPGFMPLKVTAKTVQRHDLIQHGRAQLTVLDMRAVGNARVLTLERGIRTSLAENDELSAWRQTEDAVKALGLDTPRHGRPAASPSTRPVGTASPSTMPMRTPQGEACLPS